MVNDYEYEMIKNKTGLTDSVIRQKVDTVIVTRGGTGSHIRHKTSEFLIPVATPARIADPTGVGDAYRDGIISGLMRDYPWEITGRLGAVVAAYVLEQHGTQRHNYKRHQVAARYRELFGQVPELDDFVSYL